VAKINPIRPSQHGLAGISFTNFQQVIIDVILFISGDYRLLRFVMTGILPKRVRKVNALKRNTSKSRESEEMFGRTPPPQPPTRTTPTPGTPPQMP